MNVVIRSLAASVVFATAAHGQVGDFDLREGGGLEWYKGNTHTHTLWSDGDAAPEWAVAWYADHDYDFLCLSDHNILSAGGVVKWHPISDDGKLTGERVAQIKERFGDDWVVEKESDGQRYMQLKTLPEIREHFEKPGEFILIQAEEVTGFSPSVHLNVINNEELMTPSVGVSLVEMVDVVYAQLEEQSERIGRPMVAHINHPNWGDGVTAQEMVEAAAGRFFEVYNGHGGVQNWGNEKKHYPPTDRHWDIVLSMQLKDGPEKPLYGFGTDDTHAYYEQRIGLSNAGRGWTVVLADDLDADTITGAMQEGKFYASSGVTLNAITANEDAYAVEIDAEPGVTYTTQFIGTKDGFDDAAQPILDADGKPIARASHRYSDEIGVVLAEVEGEKATYELTGDELYVRAKIVSSKLQDNPFAEGDHETAWAPPYVKP
jgi:hypothetical protein